MPKMGDKPQYFFSLHLLSKVTVIMVIVIKSYSQLILNQCDLKESACF